MSHRPQQLPAIPQWPFQATRTGVDHSLSSQLSFWVPNPHPLYICLSHCPSSRTTTCFLLTLTILSLYSSSQQTHFNYSSHRSLEWLRLEASTPLLLPLWLPSSWQLLVYLHRLQLLLLLQWIMEQGSLYQCPLPLLHLLLFYLLLLSWGIDFYIFM